MKPKKLNRRDFLKSAALVTVGGILASCGTKTNTPESVNPPPPNEPTAPVLPSEPTVESRPTDTPESIVPPAPNEPTAPPPPVGSSSDTVVYWVAWPEDTYGKAMSPMQELDEFKALLGGKKFEMKYGVPEEALLTSLAAGAPPDGGSNFNYMDYMTRGVVFPLDDLIASSSIIKKEDFIQAIWDVGVYQGKDYGLPANECFVQLGFCYNARLVKEAGLDPDVPPETWDDLYEWHKAITKIDASGNVKVIGYDPTDFMGQTIWGSSAWDVSTSWGFEWYDENAAKFNLNNEFVVDYFKTAKKFVDLIGIDKLTAFSSVQGQGGWGPAFYAEVLACMEDGYWEPGEMNAIKPELSANNRTTWMPVPASRKGTKAQGAGGHIVMIFKDGKNHEEMYKISEWLTTKTAADLIFRSIGWLPARKSYLDAVDPKTYNGLEFFLKSATEATYWGTTVKCPITTFIGTIYPQVREQVFRNELTPQQAAADLQKRAEDELANQGFNK